MIETNDLIFLDAQEYIPRERKYIIRINNLCKKPKLENFIIVEPEFLITPSEIRNSLNCFRNAIFHSDYSNNLNSNDDQSSMIIGNIVHKIIEEILTDCKFQLVRNSNMDIRRVCNEIWIENNINSKYEKVMKIYAHDIVTKTNLNEDVIREKIDEFKEAIKEFIWSFVINKNKIDKKYLNEIVEVEKTFQSRVLGIKGIIDVLFNTKTSEINHLNKYKDNNKKSGYLTPFEIKTGKQSTNAADKLQVMMYFLIIMEHMKNIKCIDESAFAYGHLAYFNLYDNKSKSSKPQKLKENIIEINFKKEDFMHLLMKRNLLAKNKLVR